MRLPALVCLALALPVDGALGCITSERVGRPPSAAEIGRINDAAEDGRALVVEYSKVADLPHKRKPPPTGCVAGWCPSPPLEPLCSTAACAQLPPGFDHPARVLAADAFKLDLSLRNGARASLPLDWVDGLKVTGYGRARGTIIGASIGTGITASTLLVLVLVLEGPKGSPLVPGHPHGCDAKCGGLFGLLTLQGALLGGIIGGAVATPHEFQLGDAPLPPSH
jgi:hypothetical protein